MGRYGKREFSEHSQYRYGYDEDGIFQESEEEEVIDLEADLDINPNDLFGELQDHAKILGWYLQLEEEVTTALKHAKATWHRAVEDKADKIRKKEEKKKIPATRHISETTLKRRVNCSLEVREAIAKYMELSSQRRAMSNCIQSLSERGRMLQSLNRKQTTEYNQTK